MAEVHTNEGRDSSRAASGALNVPTLDVDKLVRPAEGAYIEDKDHRPEPLYQYGTVDTSDTGGVTQGSVAEASPVFAEARARNLVEAAKALDPDDDTPAELVTLPQGAVTVTGTTKTAEEGREDVAGALRRMADKPVTRGGLTPGAEAAAESTEDKDGDGVPDRREGGNEVNRDNADKADPTLATPNPAPATATTAESSASRTRSGGRQAGRTS